MQNTSRNGRIAKEKKGERRVGTLHQVVERRMKSLLFEFSYNYFSGFSFA